MIYRTKHIGTQAPNALFCKIGSNYVPEENGLGCCGM